MKITRTQLRKMILCELNEVHSDNIQELLLNFETAADLLVNALQAAGADDGEVWMAKDAAGSAHDQFRDAARSIR